MGAGVVNHFHGIGCSGFQFGRATAAALIKHMAEHRNQASTQVRCRGSDPKPALAKMKCLRWEPDRPWVAPARQQPFCTIMGNKEAAAMHSSWALPAHSCQNHLALKHEIIVSTVSIHQWITFNRFHNQTQCSELWQTDKIGFSFLGSSLTDVEGFSVDKWREGFGF